MSKEIKFGHEARMAIKAGIDKACDAVRPTLGVIGSTAIIEYLGLDPVECDDGVTILKNLEFKDHYENLGLQKLRKAAIRTSSEGGDGTATTTVLTQALVSEAFKEIANDSSKIREVRERLQQGLSDTLVALTNIKREVREEDIERIATISSLDSEVAKVIAEIIKEVGTNGIVTVEKGAQLGYTKEVVKGARFDKGYLSQYFINTDRETVELIEPFIVLVDRTVSTNEQVMSLISSIGTGHDILFIADDVNSVALAMLAVNAQNKVANIAAVRNPYIGSKAREFLSDMAALTGGTVISEEKGMRLDTQTKEVCGRAEKVIVTALTTTIINGKGQEDVLNARVQSIKDSITNTTSEYSKLMLKDRLAMLTGGIGVIRVGAYTDTEFNAKKYKFDNAVNATQAALQEGILPGGGIALREVAKKIEDSMFRESLSKPFDQMCKNANVFENAHSPIFGEYGIDFKTKEVVNMFDAGIIDPFKVVRLALESAVAITSSLVSIETAITIEDEEK